MRRAALSRLALAASTGVLWSLSFPWPGAWPLIFVALAPLLLAVRDQPARVGAGLGWVAGAVAFGLLLRFLGPLSTLGLATLAAYLGLYVSAFGAAAAVLSRWRSPLAPIALVATWVALEWVRGFLLGGFGWGALGYAFAEAPRFAQLAGWGGVPLLSACAVATSAALAQLAQLAHRARSEGRRAALRWAAVALAIPGLMALQGTLAMAGDDGGATLEVAVVQGDVSPLHRWGRRGIAESLIRYGRLTDRAAAERPDLVVWPETAIPTVLETEGLAPRRRGLQRRARERWQVPILFGLAERGPADRPYNAAAVLRPDGAIEMGYRKRRLVPFGEVRPDVPLLRDIPLVLPGPELAPGVGGPPFAIAGHRVGVLICFEDTFPREALARAREADLLVAITNDGWFAESGRRQHLGVAVLRAIETGRPIARAASTGVSALIDAHGRVLQAIPRGRGQTRATLAPSTGTTLYARAPDALPLACVLLAVGCLAHLRMRRRATAPGRRSTETPASRA